MKDRSDGALPQGLAEDCRTCAAYGNVRLCNPVAQHNVRSCKLFDGVLPVHGNAVEHTDRGAEEVERKERVIVIIAQSLRSKVLYILIFV